MEEKTIHRIQFGTVSESMSRADSAFENNGPCTSSMTQERLNQEHRRCQTQQYVNSHNAVT